MKSIIHYSLFIILSPYWVFAQKNLKDTMVTVVKAFQPTIADAYKISAPPQVKDSVPPLPALHYSISPKKISTSFTVQTFKPAKMVGEPLTKLYNSLLKAGAGNYSTPFAELFFSNGRAKELNYGAHLKHLSSSATLKDYGFSGWSDNQIELYGKKFIYKHTLAGTLDYNRNVIHYFAYDKTKVNFVNPDDEKEFTKQSYSAIGGNASLQSHFTDSVRPNYFLKLKYYHLNDFYQTAENNIYALADFSTFYEKQLLHIPVSVDYYNNQSSADTSHSVLINLNPYFISSGEKWNTRLGMGIAIEGNQNSQSRFLFYPNIDFNYNVVEDIIIPFGGFSGGLKKNSLRSLTGENPFLVPNPALENTNEKWKIYCGIRGTASKTISYNTSASFSKSEDMYFFVNDNSDMIIHGFNLVYDEATLWNIHGELLFQSTEKIKFIAKGDYNKYTTENEIRPWHRPALELTFSANYNLRNKIVVNADVFVIGKRFAYTPAQGQGTGISVTGNIINELKAITDANLSLEYRYSKKLSAFLHLNNLGFKRYELWNNYPSQRFNFLAGVTVAF